MNLALIVACCQNGVIGANGKMPWRLPADMKRFRELTLNHTVIMGRKTYDSLHVKPLPKRRNIVLTRDTTLRSEDCESVHSIESLLATLRRGNGSDNATYFVIGGQEIFEQLLPYAQKIYQTLIMTELEGDTYFQLDESEWRQAREPHWHYKDENNPYDLQFSTWQKRRIL